MSSTDQAAAIVTELFESWHSPMVRFAMRSVGGLETAEEIVQEAFTDLYCELRAGKRVDHPKAWVMRVIRRRVWREYQSDHLACGPLDDGEAVATFMHESSELSLLLNCLTTREAEAVLLRAGGLDYAGIASELGVARGTVSALLARALRKMRDVAQAKPARMAKP
jgi:RNA polymerase sigma factor (sigma-70 family)